MRSTDPDPQRSAMAPLENGEGGAGWKTIASSVAAALRVDIANGRLTAGTRLRQNELARRFNVSTTPVRGALGILERQGLARIDPQRGATVFVPSEADLREHYEIRIALESLAAAKAAERFTAEDVARAAEVLEEMHTCLESMRYVRLNTEFHARIYAASGRARLVEMIAGLRAASDAYLQIYATTVLPSPRIEAEHREILAACKARDPERAAAAVEHHLTQTVTHVADELEARSARLNGAEAPFDGHAA
jgi:DNA-binding GntR family transcriptional regulator